MKKTADILTLAVFIAIIAVFGVMFWVMEDNAVSDTEGRNLQQLPEFTLERLNSGEYALEINTYFSDQFPFRDKFVTVKALAELCLLKGENNGVLYGDDGMLAVKDFNAKNETGAANTATDSFNEDFVSAQLEKLNSFVTNIQTPTAVVIPPRVIDIAGSSFSYPADSAEAFEKLVNSYLGDKDWFVELDSLFTEKHENGEYVYYKTDHHWTSLGAYYCYVEIMKSFGMDYYDLSEFNVQTVSDSFLGSTYRASGFGFYGDSDIIDIYYLKGTSESDYLTEICNPRTNELMHGFSGFYDSSYLAKSDKYSFFLSGTNVYTRVTRLDGVKREKLLIVKDSFAHSLVPFLALHFDLEIINYESDGMQNVTKLAEQYSADRILLVYNAENIITSGKLVNLR